MFIPYECKEVYYPKTYEEIEEIVKEAIKKRQTLHVLGSGKNHVGKKISADICVSTANLNRIIEVSKSDLYVTAQAGVRVDDLQQTLSSYGLFLPFTYSGSLGGLASTNKVSLFSLLYPYPKDFLLGAKIVLGDGTIIRSGSKTTKFSSGYKIWKTLSGALGTLGIYLELTFRLIPKPERIVYTEVSSPMKYLPLRPWGLISFVKGESIRNYLVLGGFSAYIEKISKNISFSLIDGVPSEELECERVFGITVPRGTELEAIKSFNQGIAYIGSGYIRVCDEKALELRSQGISVIIEKGCKDGEDCFGFKYTTYHILKKALDPYNIFPMVL